MLLKTRLTEAEVAAEVWRVSRERYSGNIILSSEGIRAQGRTRDGRRKLRFALATLDSHAYGSRLSWSGRHMRAASWEAFRDILQAIFDADPKAHCHTSLADYNGAEGFAENYPQTAYKNIGSQFAPITMPQCSVPVGGD